MRINYNAARPGTNRMAQAFASPTRQDAEDRELDRLSRADQRSASTSKNVAEAGLLDQRKAFLDDQPGFLSSQAGAPLPLAKKFSDYIKTGNWGQTEVPTSTDAEGELLAGLQPSPITEIPEDIKPLMEKFTRALQTQGGLRGASTSNPEQIAKSQGEYQGQSITDSAVDLARQGKFDESSSLNQAGKIGQQIKRYDDIGQTGAVYSPSTGEVVTNRNPLLDAFVKKTASGNKTPSGYRLDENGDLEFIPGGPADPFNKNQKITDTERMAAGYASRMDESEKIISQNTQGQTPGLKESAAAGIPLIGKMASNLARDPTRQKYRQAQEDWVRSKLRKESGAVIADEEMDREIRVYFPQIGDSKEVISQKETSRNVAMDAMRQSAGPAYDLPRKQKPQGGAIRYDKNGNRI